MSLQDVARYLADLIAAGAPGGERTVVVCDKDDEAATVAWTKAKFGANGTVVALTSVDEFVAKVTRARTQGTPATGIVIHPSHFATDPEDGFLKLTHGQQDLPVLAVAGFKRMEFGGRLNNLVPLLEIAGPWGLSEIVGWTQRLFTGVHTFNLKPPRPSTAAQRKAAAADLLNQFRPYYALSNPLRVFSAMPQQEDALAEALKGAGPKIDVPFEWFGGNESARVDLTNPETGLNMPRANVSPQDITFSIERAKIGALLAQVSSHETPMPKDVKTITENRFSENVIQRMVVTIT